MRLFIISCLIVGKVFSQSTTGLTGVPDTSFTVQREYDKLKKNYPQLRFVDTSLPAHVRKETDLIYCRIGARELKLDVFYPRTRTKKGRVALMIIHGGGWRSGNKTQHHAMAQQLAALGYVCFTPEYRLSTEALYPAAVHDLKAAVRWVHGQAVVYGIDTGKVAVAGFSAGGELAAFLATTVNDPQYEGSCHAKAAGSIHALIDLDGTLSFVHPESGEGDDSKKTSAATYWFGYSKKENPALWKEASPLTHAGKGTPPTLFINSSVERMHAGREDFMAILQSHGIYTEVRLFPDAPHAFPLFDPWFTPTVAYIDAFLKKIFTKPAR